MPESSAKSTLRFDHVSVSFAGDPALKDLSFELLEGDTRIILGAAGSGKTAALAAAIGCASGSADAGHRGRHISLLVPR